MNQFDRKLLRDLAGKSDTVQDGLIFSATDEQLWSALACLEEEEFTKLKGVGAKVRVVLELRRLGK